MKLSAVKKVYETNYSKEQAAKDGFDTESINCSVAHQTAKVGMMAVTMGSKELKLTKKKLTTKTLPRYIAEHSVMSGYAYSATVLATHFIEGPRPTCMNYYKPEELRADAKETIEWMKTAMNAKEIFPVNPNLVLSTDDTSLFVFEGKQTSGDWEWKIIDKTNGNSSVRSDCEVRDDAENTGGLRVRLTFTFAASGLAASPYIAVLVALRRRSCQLVYDENRT